MSWNICWANRLLLSYQGQKVEHYLRGAEHGYKVYHISIVIIDAQ